MSRTVGARGLLPRRFHTPGNITDKEYAEARVEASANEYLHNYRSNYESSPYLSSMNGHGDMVDLQERRGELRFE
jgi:hypothetical protein